MTDTIHNTILPMTDTTAEPEDYTGEDGLLYCGKCRKPKEAYFPEGKTFFGRDRHPSECDCQRAARKEREAAEKRRSHLETVERLKRQGFTDQDHAGLDICATITAAARRSKNARRICGTAGKQIKDGNYRAASCGAGVGTGKSYFAGCIANALMEQEVAGVHDKLCSNIKRPCRQLCGQERIYFPPLQLPPAHTLTILEWSVAQNTVWNRSTA